MAKVSDHEKKEKANKGCCAKLNSKQIDGGWAWMVFVACCVNYIIVIPLIQNFGLIYKDLFAELRMSSTDITTIISTNSAFGMILGVFNAPLLKTYGFRKMAFVAITINLIGFFITSFSSSFIMFFIFYGMITSIGAAFELAAFSLAFNSYFRKRRSKVTGKMMTITGLGPILAPQLISYFLFHFGVRYTVITLVAISLNLYVAACLLRPITEVVEVEKEEEEEETVKSEKRRMSLVAQQSVVEVEGPTLPDIEPRRNSLCVRRDSKPFVLPVLKKASSITIPEAEPFLNQISKSKPQTWNSVSHLDNQILEDMHLPDHGLTKSWRSFNDSKVRMYASVETLGLEYEDHMKQIAEVVDEKEEEQEEEQKKKSLMIRFWHKIKKTYDLDLLQDPWMVNLFIGMSIAVVAEITFSLMTPFILQDFGLNTEQIATFYSILSVGDIILRYFAPYIGDYLKFETKMMYLVALGFLLLCRLALFIGSSTKFYYVMAAFLGMSKGFRTIYWVLVIPNSVPLDKLASASAMQQLVNGLMMQASGPLIGMTIRIYDDYRILIFISNILTLITIAMWSTEFVIKWRRRKREEKQNEKA